MADVVNLRRERKRRARDAGAADAADNRLQFGRTKTERALSQAARTLAEQHLDGHQRVGADAFEPAPGWSEPWLNGARPPFASVHSSLQAIPPAFHSKMPSGRG